ncbi:hypothetical protein [Dactylosporangium sp. CA-092794]|uniref:hypothetical protein n=1 Tax=Dactylosporangium sp. CA-092794 TaxID=3239929 RepID=UPI003D92A5FE
MSLMVEPEALRRFGALMQRAGEDVAAGAEHVDRYAFREDAGGAWLAWFAPLYERTVDEVSTVLGRLRAVADAAHAGLDQASAYYTTTDQTVAATFDAGLPPGQCPPGDLDTELAAVCLPGGSFRDVREPQQRLREPEPQEPTGPGGIPVGLLDTLSLSGAALYTARAVFGFDPVERLTGPLLGDWERIAACGTVLRQLAALCSDIAVNIAAGDRTLMTYWSGNAAAAADDYITTLAVRTDRLADPITTIGQLHEQAATVVFTVAETIKGVVTTLIDLAVAAAAIMAAGTALIETGVGPLVAAGVAATIIGELYETYDTGTAALRTAYNVLTGLAGLIAAASSRLETTWRCVRSRPVSAAANSPSALR